MTSAAVVGIGDISALHLDAIGQISTIDLVGVCDVDPERAERAGQTHGVPWFTDHRDLLAAVSPDVVHITTPHNQHVPVALDALEAGSHVLTEKPIGHSVAEGQRLVDAAAHTSLKVGVNFQNRYNPSAVAIREVVDSGRLGPIVGARGAVWWFRPAAYYDRAPWRGQWNGSGGGVLINQAIHTLDLLLWYLGRATRVTGVASNLSLPGVIEVEDTATVLIDHSSGVRSTFFATNAHHENADVELEISGRDGSVSLAGGTVRLTDSTGTQVIATDEQATGQRSYWGRGHSMLIEDFHARLGESEPFWISPDDGLAALRVLRQTYQQSGMLPSGSAL